MTPHTVPSSPMNGPPATAVERMIMPFSSEIAWALTARSNSTRTESNHDALILVVMDLAMKSVWTASVALCGWACRPAELGRTGTGLFLS